jgi:hypothetical protein
MATDNTRTAVNAGTLGVISSALGILGLIFYWWLPLGIVLSLSGLVLGLIGWFLTGSLSGRLGWLITGIVVSAAALVLCIVAGELGLETLTFGPLR